MCSCGMKELPLSGVPVTGRGARVPPPILQGAGRDATAPRSQQMEAAGDGGSVPHGPVLLLCLTLCHSNRNTGRCPGSPTRRRGAHALERGFVGRYSRGQGWGSADRRGSYEPPSQTCGARGEPRLAETDWEDKESLLLNIPVNHSLHS